MKKALVILFLVGLVGCSGPRVEVPPGHYAKVMSSAGYQQGLITEAKSMVLPYEWYTKPKLVLVESSDNPIKEKMEIFMPKDKLKLSFDLRGTFTITTKEEEIDLLFTKITPMHIDDSPNTVRIDFDQVYKVYGEPVVRTISREVVVKYNTQEVLINMKAISAEIESEVKKSLEGSPLKVINLSLSDIKPPSVITDAQELAKKREIEIEKAEADKMVRLKEAEAKLAIALKDQEIDLLEAETQVKVEQKLSESVTPAFVQQRMLKILDKAAANGNLIIVTEEVLRNPAMLFNISENILKEKSKDK